LAVVEWQEAIELAFQLLEQLAIWKLEFLAQK
jgi:hypothetical protein